MELHHGKHHQAYVNNLNNAIAGDAKLSQLTLEELVAKAGKHPAAVRNNAGGHWNHTFFWNIMGPAEKSGTPSPELLKAINDEFGSLEAFKSAFSKAGLSRFGSGWVWLIVDKKGKLVITTTPNQDNPLMDVAETRGTPVLGNDLWEHAYYLKYNNRRGDYLGAWWQVVNWDAVSRHYADAVDHKDGKRGKKK
jgi:Fe-Mn family superoxide dismutase